MMNKIVLQEKPKPVDKKLQQKQSKQVIEKSQKTTKPQKSEKIKTEKSKADEKKLQSKKEIEKSKKTTKQEELKTGEKKLKVIEESKKPTKPQKNEKIQKDKKEKSKVVEKKSKPKQIIEKSKKMINPQKNEKERLKTNVKKLQMKQKIEKSQKSQINAKIQKDNKELLQQEEEEKQKLTKKLPKNQHPSHHNLETFLAIKDIDKNTTLYRGTLYEYETIDCLQKLFGIVTRRVGKANDAGIDFRGRWNLPNKRLMIIGQCKSFNIKCSSNVVRDLEGTLCRESKETIGILSSFGGFTEAAIKRYYGSPWPMMLVTVIDGGKICEKFLWNKTAEAYLEKLQITLFYKEGSKSKNLYKRPLLVYDGKEFTPDEKEVYWEIPEKYLNMSGISLATIAETENI
ncbi:1289_t:CDS:2 [Diversispora eburnea]|uniref:1289_t:CDS:1 n=1 Tax=Diversispora eburnea TaxID=1213867 RepID=A0A9N9AIT5_9GLOM|nr:1289_t:CDS:2 [Diversispora eburnea]